MATIVYTSGTTGFSKGVMLQHHSLMVNARFYVDCLDVTTNRRVVSFLPLAHCYGCAFDLISPSIGGGHVTFIDRLPTPKVLMAAFAEIRPTVVLSVPLIIEKIFKSRIKPQLRRPLKAMMKVPAINRLIHSKIRRKIFRRLRRRVPGGGDRRRGVQQGGRRLLQVASTSRWPTATA